MQSYGTSPLYPYEMHNAYLAPSRTYDVPYPYRGAITLQSSEPPCFVIVLYLISMPRFRHVRYTNISSISTFH